MLSDNIYGSYDDICTMIRNMLNAEGAMVIVFGGSKGSGVGTNVSKIIHGTLPDHLRGIADQIDMQLNKPQLTHPGVADLGDGVRGLFMPDGRVSLYDERLSVAMPLRADSARRLHDWLHTRLEPAPLPPLSQAIIEQARLCGCGICEACEAVAAQARAPGDMSNG